MTPVLADFDNVKLIKPGAAMSTRSTQGSCANAACNQPAISNGLLRHGFANKKARFELKSPWAGSLHRSTLIATSLSTGANDLD
jgi:hypothetical protein